MGTKVKLHNVRLFFPDLFKAVEFKPGDGKPRYNATFGIEKDDAKQIELIEAAIKAEAETGWKTKAAAVLKGFRGNNNKFCFVDGDTKTYEGAEGVMLLSAHRKEKDGPPTLLPRRKNADGTWHALTKDDGTLYSGCYVNATVEIWAQTQPQENTGIRCTLLGVQFNDDGVAFSGAKKGDPNDFDDLGDGADDEGGGDDVA